MAEIVALDSPRSDYYVPLGRDMAANPGLTLHELERILSDMREEPAWRRESDRCVDYYDNKQLTLQQKAEIEARGMAPIITNLIKPVVDVVLGMEAKTRTDWRVVADDDEHTDIAEAESALLHEAEREARADRACSDAYAGQIKAGLGWVEVSRNSDPFKYPHRVANVHRRELWWDWRDQSPGLETARYMVRRRWFDWDQAAAYFPQHKDLLWASITHWADWTPHLLEGSPMAANWEEERTTTIEEYEWRDSIRKRVTIFEVWYRVVMQGLCIKLPNGMAVEYNPKNAVHALAVARGITTPFQAIFSRVRGSFWIGPHRVADWDTGADEFPYVPFWGHREDLTGVPYGVIRAMIDPQDEVNARRSKMLWLLSAKRVQVDSDALDTKYTKLRQLADEIGRPDAVVVLNPDRKNKGDGFKVDDQLDLSAQQFNVMLESKRAIQETGGVFQQMLGDAKGGADSGIAINSLVEQGMTTLAEINDNYRFARRLVGEKLHKQIRADMVGKEVKVAVARLGQKKTIVLNKPVPDKTTGYVVLENNTARARVRVALEDVPQTPGYRAQMLQMLTETTKALPPELQAILAPHLIEASDLKDRHQIADQMRKALNMVDPERMTPEEKKAAADAAAFQKRAANLELAEREAKVAASNAAAAKTRMETMGGADGAMKAEFEAKMQKVMQGAQQKIDALTDKLRAVQADREVERQKIANEAHQAEVDSGREIALKERLAQVEKDKAIEIAKINAEAKKVVDSAVAKIQAEASKTAEKLDKPGKGKDKQDDGKQVAEAVKSMAAETAKAIRDAGEAQAKAIEKLAEAKPQKSDKSPEPVSVVKQGDGYVVKRGDKTVVVKLDKEKSE